jgi:hypothetical protein
MGLRFVNLESSYVSTLSLSATSRETSPTAQNSQSCFPTPGIASAMKPQTGIRPGPKILRPQPSSRLANSFYFIALFQRFRTIP